MKELEIQKQKLRKEYILIRNNIEHKKEKSQIIIDKLKEEVSYKNAKVIALYKSLKSEVDTDELIKYSINIGKIVVLPKVVKNELKFYKIDLLENFVKSKFGVEEPVGNEEKFVDKNNIDLVIVPGLCFDKGKNRLGFGKGFYDRFLKNTTFQTIAICFEEQIIDKKLPISNNDVKMQQIITDEKIYL